MKVVDWSDSSCHLPVTLFWCFYPFSKDITCCINHVCTVVSVVLSNLDCGRNKTNSYLLFSGWDLQQRKGRKLDGILRYNFLFISSFEMQVFFQVMHIGAPCCGMNAAVRYSTFFIWRGGKIFLLKFFYPDHSPAIAFTLGTTLLASTMGLTGWSRFYCLIFLHVLILVLYSCTHPSLTRRKVGPSYFYPIYNFSVYGTIYALSPLEEFVCNPAINVNTTS